MNKINKYQNQIEINYKNIEFVTEKSYCVISPDTDHT